MSGPAKVLQQHWENRTAPRIDRGLNHDLLERVFLALTALQVVANSEIFLQGGFRVASHAEVMLLSPGFLAPLTVAMCESREAWTRCLRRFRAPWHSGLLRSKDSQ